MKLHLDVDEVRLAVREYAERRGFKVRPAEDGDAGVTFKAYNDAEAGDYLDTEAVVALVEQGPVDEERVKLARKPKRGSR
jgi:hypothetical protein